MNRLGLVLLLLVGLALAACSKPAEPPEYVIRLTSAQGARCTGVALSPRRIMTVLHCKSSRLYANGIPVISWAISDQHPDLMFGILYAPLELDQYAVVGEPQPDLPATLIGYCPFNQIFGDPVRAASYAKYTDLGHLWHVDGVVCRGDSGGPIIQDGVVVGIAERIRTDQTLITVSNEFYTSPLPPHKIDHLLTP